ncbi:winged helix-turn-helix domain-containing protein [Castellaniella defragrans]|uniref:winged helix-turn-helix domain-containing protein n=1 Tax=Castellaniella defragrans TaxID=75697 RepID=UPI002B001FF2|nr:crosslink repair DNA glycosylase YcaQ family protein [Castellaniella defragrans]
MDDQPLTLDQARRLQLAAQGLLTTPRRKATPADLRQCIARMQLLQIDTIHVVARSPYLVLFSRLGHYPPAWLDAALAQGEVFETWAHEACFAPMADVGLHRSYNQQARVHWGLKRARENVASHRAQLDALLAHIDAHGPVKSAHFKRTDGQGGGWWGWKDEKRWLETLFATGALMVARRDKFQRVYDLAHRVCPALADAPLPDAAEVHAQFVEKAVLALGITQARWIHDYFRQKPRLKDPDLDALVARGVLRRVDVRGWSSPGYVHRRHADLLQKALEGRLRATHTTLLSPFDPLVWDRERASALWGFDYRIECYTPAEKRTYGYFVLPILHRGALVGRLDAKAHRTQGVFEIKALFTERDATLNDAALQAVAGAIRRCADWHGTPEVRVRRTEPADLLPRLRACLESPASLIRAGRS